VSPSQKREIVFFLREQKGAIVLAIGDGANDMPMIRSAHVGVGILGQEGGQAASCADYSISQFRYMSPLLLKHGQSNYIRMANLVCYIFYKNLLLSLSMFWFNLNCGFSSQSIYSEGGIQLYNVFYTSLPIIYYAAHDMMYNKNTFYRFPQTYRACINNHFFGTRVFWSWMGTAVFESFFLGIIPLYLMTGVDTQFGYMSSFQMPGMMSLTAIVICSNTKIAFIQNKFHWSHYLLILAGICSWFITCVVIGEVTDFDWNVYKEYQTILAGPYSWLGLLLCLGIVIGRDLYSAAVARHFNFEPYHIVQEADVEQAKRLERNLVRSLSASDSGGKRRSVVQQGQVEGPRVAPLSRATTESKVLGGVGKQKEKETEKENDLELVVSSRAVASRSLSKDNDPNRQFSTPRSGYATVASTEMRNATPV
jgi:magnesium-transporting ATPase (P-type)